MAEYDVRVLGGLPLTVEGHWLPAEPDVGIFSRTFEPEALYDRRGKRATWAERHMRQSDWDDVAKQVHDQED